MQLRELAHLENSRRFVLWDVISRPDGESLRDTKSTPIQHRWCQYSAGELPRWSQQCRPSLAHMLSQGSENTECRVLYRRARPQSTIPTATSRQSLLYTNQTFSIHTQNRYFLSSMAMPPSDHALKQFHQPA